MRLLCSVRFEASGCWCAKVYSENLRLSSGNLCIILRMQENNKYFKAISSLIKFYFDFFKDFSA
jgi:hypothetical protein